MYSEELHDLCSSPNTRIVRFMKSRRMRWTGHITRRREKWNVYVLLIGKLEGKRPLGRTRHSWIITLKWISSDSMLWCGLG
jgi:hypothetical protein